uniref:RxLR effector candidate protein n=1 Tax=Hyaloperonospora arabidopsidis (strain Emoy2) TaxID=559515 RepID=M4C6F4_HYAAE
MVFVTLVELAVFTLIWTSTGDEDKTYKGFFYDSSEDLNKVVNVTFVVITLTVQLLLSVFIWYLRAKTRTRFELPGSVFMDWLSTWFCPCCTVAQLRTHVRCYQPGSCDFRAPDVLQAYPGKSYAV